MVNTDRIALAIAPLFRNVTAKVVQRRRSQFEALQVPPGRVLFLGDSITQEGAWDELFPELATLNRGISGDTVTGVLRRLDQAVNTPSAISLLIGTNDLTGNGQSRKVDDIAPQFRELVENIVRQAPGATLLVNSVMPRTAWLAPRIKALNAHYRSIAADAGATFIDLWPALAGSGDELRTQFTQDNIHLNGAGYRAWVDVLRPQLAPFSR